MKLRCKNNVGAGRELQALLPKGFRLDSTDFDSGLTEEVWITVWSEIWVQFPTTNWEKLQDAIMKQLQTVLEDTESPSRL